MNGTGKKTNSQKHKTPMTTCCEGEVVLFARNVIKYSRLNYFETVNILVKHVAVKCSFLLIFYCKIKIQVKFLPKRFGGKPVLG